MQTLEQKIVRASPEDCAVGSGWDAPFIHKGKPSFVVCLGHDAWCWTVTCTGGDDRTSPEFLPFCKENGDLIPITRNRRTYRKRYSDPELARKMYDAIRDNIPIRSLLNRLGFKRVS